MVGKQYQPLPTSDRTVSGALVKVMSNHLFYLMPCCLLVGLGGGEEGDTDTSTAAAADVTDAAVDGVHTRKLQASKVCRWKALNA